MVSFEELVKTWNLREVILKFLENSLHPTLMRLSKGKIDMDVIQARVLNELPKFTLETGMKLGAVMVVYWLICYLFIHYLMVTPFMHIQRGKKGYDWVEHWHKLTSSEKRFYTSFIHANWHAVISTLLSLYCFVYADGQRGTTWFHCNHYKLNMFDVQKYCHVVSIAYLVYDTFFCLATAKFDALMIQTFLHHFFAIFGNTLGIYIGGFIGSASQLTWFTEISTPFVNLRALLAYHKLQSTTLYAINGLVMTFVFFVGRVVFYYYIIFIKMLDMVAYRSVSFWALYPEENYIWCYIGIAMYCGMYLLNLFWFSKMLAGLCKGLGLLDACQRTERFGVDSDSESEFDEDLKQKQD